MTGPHLRPHLSLPYSHSFFLDTQKGLHMNRIIWLVGLVVIILFIAGYFGLR